MKDKDVRGWIEVKHRTLVASAQEKKVRLKANSGKQFCNLAQFCLTCTASSPHKENRPVSWSWMR